MMMMMLVPSMRLAGLENESVPARVRGSGLVEVIGVKNIFAKIL